MKKSVSELKNAAQGRDVFVLGSGASMDSYDPLFFKNKFMIGMNNSYKFFPVNYSMFTHDPYFISAVDKTPCVISEFDLAERVEPRKTLETNADYWMFKTGNYQSFEKNLEAIGKDDEFCLGNSIAISVINFAAHLGASCIYLVGVDCCAINGRFHIKNYYDIKSEMRDKNSRGELEQFRQYKNDFFLRNVKEIKMVRDRIRAVYGCDVVSISPFIGMTNEGADVRDYLTMADLKAIMEK